MATLSNSAQYTRKFIKYLLIFIGIALIATFAAKLISDQIEASRESVIVSDNKFGKLPDLKLIKSLDFAASEGLIYDLQTSNGRLNIEDAKGVKYTQVPSVVYVYKYFQSQPSLYLNDEIRNYGQNIGFKTVAEDLNTFMRWFSSNGYRILEIEKSTRNVEIRTDISKDTSFDTLKPFTAGLQKYQTLLYSSLSKKGVLNSNYTDISYVNEFNSEFITWNSDKGVFERTDSANRAEFARINLSKTVAANYVKVPSSENTKTKIATYLYPRQIISTVRTDTPRISSIHGIIGTKEDEIYFLKANGTEYDLSSPGLYDIKPIQTAFDELQAGKGVLVDLRRNNRNDDYTYVKETVKAFHIKNIYLDYYEPFARTQQFLQPIYVFRGYADLADTQTAEFTFYVPAINY